MATQNVFFYQQEMLRIDFNDFFLCVSFILIVLQENNRIRIQDLH